MHDTGWHCSEMRRAAVAREACNSESGVQQREGRAVGEVCAAPTLLRTVHSIPRLFTLRMTKCKQAPSLTKTAGMAYCKQIQ